MVILLGARWVLGKLSWDPLCNQGVLLRWLTIMRHYSSHPKVFLEGSKGAQGLTVGP